MEKSRIMVVEDEGVVALQIREALEGMGYTVPVVALSGEEALSKLLEVEPDLVLMDIQLKGGLSGIETARRLRHRLDIPVVYLTAFSDDATLDQAQLTEPYGYVLKPFDEKSLHAIIQMSLKKHQRTRGVRESGWWMSAVAASMVEAVVICDPKGYVKFANPSAEALMGLAGTDLLEKRLSDTVHLIDAEKRTPLSFPVSEPLLEGKSTLRGNCLLVTSQGKEPPVEFSASPLRSPEGTLFGILYVFRGTSEREKLQNLVLRGLEELAAAQRRALPSPETAIAGIRCEALSLPTAPGGGDALCCFRLDEGHAGFYALDVIGQGILSSVFSFLLRTFLSPNVDRGGMLVERAGTGPNAAEYRGGPNAAEYRILAPADVVRELNRRLFLQEEANPFFTIAYGVFDEKKGMVRLVRAGAPFPLLLRAGGTLRVLKPEGFAVGLFPRAEIATEEFRFEKGDRLFLYSDGLVDCANSGGMTFSAARFSDLLVEGRGLPLAAQLQAVRRELVAWRGSESFADDVSLLALERV
jgi:PAS domain S-box-containing protein